MAVMKTKIATVLLLAVALAWPALPAGPSHWVATWGASPSPQLPDAAQMRKAGLVFDNQTLREVVHTSIGGDAVRVRLSNVFGADAVEIAAAHIALRGKGPEIVRSSDRVLTFSGRPAVSIPPGALVLSDPVKLSVPAAGDLAISLYLPKPATGSAIHYSAQQTSYAGQGDLTGAEYIPEATILTSWIFLTGVDVLAPEPVSLAIAFGDSITDGARSSFDTNHRWPDFLAARLLARPGGGKVAVIDEGIGGNRVLHDPVSDVRYGVSALARFERDAIAQAGVKYIVLLEGINDLGHYGPDSPASEKVSAEDIIAGLTQMVERAHEKGIKVIGCTLTPFEGVPFGNYFTPEKEVKRKAVNEWIRTAKTLDGVVDFDKALRDPEHPDRMFPAYDSGDHLHPGDAGYKAMGEAIPLALFR
jgi:lysophospholipase L1-like esterase